MATEEGTLSQLVVLGASAGGIDVLSTVLKGLPADFPAPIVVAQHLDPKRPSHLVEILQRTTPLTVRPGDGRVTLEPGTVYVLPADHRSEILHGEMVRTDDDGSRPTPSIDRILSSASRAYEEGLIAVILSGSGSDGASGARDVKAAGGTIVIQNPETASYPSMPQALSPSIVDIVADAEAIGPLLQELVSRSDGSRRADDERLLRLFLDQLRERSGIDFASYKRATIQRRLHRRIVATGTSGLREYVRYLQGHQEEYQRLTSSFLIKVTEFYRDADLFEHLRDTIVPKLIADSESRDHELRLWSAGCATGEEAYSLAMLVADALGDELDQFNVRIFATDVDLDAITFARRGIYARSSVAGLAPEILDRHFNKVGESFEVKKRIRALTVFGQHDLGQRAPFPRVDLALCRNVLIYFTTELQKRALQLFAFALRDGGYLVLGKAESTSPLPESFVLEQARLKIYRREGERVLIPPARVRETAPLVPLRIPTPGRMDWSEPRRERERTFGSAERADTILVRLPVGVVVLNRDYDIQTINAAARRMLSIHGPAVGEDFVHLLAPSLVAGLRGAIDAAFRGDAGVPSVYDVHQPSAEGTDIRSIEMGCYPVVLDDATRQVESVMVVASDISAIVSARRDLEEALSRESDERARLAVQARELARANAELVDANQALTTSNAELRNVNEEMQVANEEVQAATEEVETLNEELQATNEELETLNEELQATVEELNATNDDLQARTLELQETAVAMEDQRSRTEAERHRLRSILDAMQEAIVVISPEGEVVLANQAFRDVVGKPEAIELPKQALRALAAKRAVDTSISLDGRRFSVRGGPIDGDVGYGLLTFGPTQD